MSSASSLPPSRINEILGNPVLVDFTEERERRRERRNKLGGGGFHQVNVVSSKMTMNSAETIDKERKLAMEEKEQNDDVCDKVLNDEEAIHNNKSKDEDDNNDENSTTAATSLPSTDSTMMTSESLSPQTNTQQPSSWSFDGMCQTVKNALFLGRPPAHKRVSMDDEELQLRRNECTPGNKEQENGNHDIGDSPISSPEEIAKRRRLFQPSKHRANKRRKQTMISSWFGLGPSSSSSS